MNKSRILLFLILLSAIAKSFVIASDTIHIREAEPVIDLNPFIQEYQDEENEFDIKDIVQKGDGIAFLPVTDPKLNYEYTRSTVWLKFNIGNDRDEQVHYILEISNPDLDRITFSIVSHDSILHTVQTGELSDVGTREIYHRNFLFNISLNPGEHHTYYLSVNNNGHPCLIPISLKERDYFVKYDSKTDIFNWLIYGLLVFIIIFNLYQFIALKDRVNLYHSLSLFFAIVSFIHYEGYFYIINPPVIVERLKWLNPCFYSVFLLLFTRSFVTLHDRFKTLNKFIEPLIVLVLIVPLAYNLKYPFSLIADIGIYVVILIAFSFIILMTLASYRRDYLPSKLFFYAYVVVFVGVLIHLCKEFNIIKSGFLAINAIKTGLALQNIILTLAILERFRINQDEAAKTIRESMGRIELQNKELEIINTELEKLSIVASETDNSIAVYDKDGTIEWGNTGFEQLYEVKLNELIRNQKDKIEDIIPNSNIKRYVDKCLTSKLPIMFETKVQLEDKKIVWIQTTLSPYLRANELQKIIAIDSDITNLKIYEKELETAKEKAVESDQLKTAFLGNLSHEIRTPLNGILGFSELLSRTELNEDEKKIYLDIIKSSGEQLMHIIDDIVDISLIESNQLKIYLAEFDLKSLLQDIMEFFSSYKATINKTHLELESDIRIDDDSSYIISDSFRLRQILTNLIRNAFKFTSEGYIRVNAYTQQKFLYFCVEDSGIGISPEKKDVIFERFRQGEETLSRKYGGTGLGLSISKGILEKMGGKIWIDTSYHSGFRIFFSIPLIISRNRTDDKKDQKPTINNIGHKIENKNILVVEDHDVSYKYLEEILLPYKVKLFWATNGNEAVSLVKQNDFDLILMDINLPEMDGVAATREIRKISEDVPIFVQTAHAMESEIKMIMASGCNDMIAKPFSEKEFFDKLAKIF